MDKDISIKNGYISAFLCEDKYIKDMMIINTKCLVDDKINRCVYIDYNRLKNELIYYKFYGVKNNDFSYNLNILLPIVISNTNLDKSEREVIKHIKYHVNNKEDSIHDYILSSVIYNYTIHTILNNIKIEYSDLLQQIKQRIIEFKLDIDKSEIISFQKSKINCIQVIDRYLNNKFENIELNSISRFLDILYQIYIEDKNETIEGLNSIKNSILSILKFDINQNNIDNIEFINSMADYVLKLRKYNIYKKIFNEQVDPRNIINLDIGDTKQDPILNNIKVIDKKFHNNILTVKIKSKTGDYTFRFKKS